MFNINNYQKKSDEKRVTSKITLKRCFILLAILIIAISVISTPIVNNYLNKIPKVTLNDDNIEISDSNLDNEQDKIPKSTDIKNIAIFGIDGTDDESCRSDCIMILTIDNIHDKIKLTSIIRDSYVDIPKRQHKDKINHAYAFGGPSLAIQTLNSNFNLDISKFVSVNFSSFPKIIDSVDGINLTITDDEIKYINKYIDELNNINNTSSPDITTSGDQIVDGTQALAYSRIRYTDGGDFKRSHRQRTVIEHLFEKLKNTSIMDYPNLLNEFLPLIKTNLTNKEIISIGMDLNTLKDNGIIQSRFPEDNDSDGKMINGIYYYVFDQQATKNKIHEFIYEN